MLRMRLTLSYSTSRGEISPSPLICSRNNMATFCRLFLMRWCISRTTAVLVTSRAFSMASAVWLASVENSAISSSAKRWGSAV